MKKSPNVEYRAALLLMFGLGSFLVFLAFTASQVHEMRAQVVQLARENEDLRLAANRRLRASSHFLLPGFTSDILERCTRSAEDFGVSELAVCSTAKNENGGDMLECGIQHIDADVMQHYAARDQQFAQLAKMISREQTKLIMGDPELQTRLLTRLSQHYNPTHWQKWVISVRTLMDDFRDDLPATPARQAHLRAIQRGKR